ncbi:hypothetical protein HPP92_002170 [Vanilla planifolia]|uniref:Aladin n=1 Tax=Vanilla planifolia TaxID=51239 RepID=A0A835RSX8_VANPL|nr:hypothetical protein HPP92_002170 [Vanilla planifolia]
MVAEEDEKVPAAEVDQAMVVVWFEMEMGGEGGGSGGVLAAKVDQVMEDTVIGRGDIWVLNLGSSALINRGSNSSSTRIRCNFLWLFPVYLRPSSINSDGTFYLWETNTWTSELWSSTSGYVTGAAWDPEGRTVLLAFSESDTLGSLHFTSRPPALEAHLLPVELPEITSLLGSRGIEKLAWDASGERLALSFRNREDMYSGLIAVFDVKRTPLISLSLIGFIRGPGENPKPLAFSFYSKFKQGPLLSVCWSSGFCCTYPLIFRAYASLN